MKQAIDLPMSGAL